MIGGSGMLQRAVALHSESFSGDSVMLGLDALRSLLVGCMMLGLIQAKIEKKRKLLTTGDIARH